MNTKLRSHSGVGALVIIVGILAFAATRPDSFRVQRSASILATPERIFPLINDLRRFNTWNPFEKKDPNLQGRYSGAAKIIHMFFDMDRMIGKDFENGLAELKAIVESPAVKQAALTVQR